MIGRILAHYHIKSALGAGGMGEVYRATDTKLGRDVAVKVLPADMAASAERRERFQREARVLAALDNPHIVTIHSVEEASGVHFLTMELVDGESLDRLILGRGLPIERILEIATAVAEGLSAAHEKGIIHRDLVPDVSVPGAPECGRLAGDRPCALSRSRSRGQRENIRRPASGHAQLTDVGSGYQLWSERFDRNAQDIFAVQDEIAAGVVEAVRVRARL